MNLFAFSETKHVVGVSTTRCGRLTFGGTSWYDIDSAMLKFLLTTNQIE